MEFEFHDKKLVSALRIFDIVPSENIFGTYDNDFPLVIFRCECIGCTSRLSGKDRNTEDSESEFLDTF